MNPLAIRVEPEGEPLAGSAVYRGLERVVELAPALPRPEVRIKTLALGKLTLTLDHRTQHLLGLLAFTPSGRWRVETAGPPPEPDLDAALVFTMGFGEDDFYYADIRPVFEFHEESGCLKLRFSGEGALAVRAGNCLIAGISRSGELSDLWLERLKFRP